MAPRDGGLQEQGNETTNIFQELVEAAEGVSAEYPAVTKKGADAILKLNDLEIKVEIKTGKTSTSQVRPYEYEILAVYQPEWEKWYVFSPVDILHRARRLSGQHSRNPFECVNIGKPGTPQEWWRNYYCEDIQVIGKIFEAYETGQEEENVVYKNWCVDLLAKFNEQADGWKTEFDNLL
tara:strand:+ start:101 stop:637 length:537 start_codon:yes stop_codon:yes gene_type:complete